ncbi:MAG TPA: PTS glucose transporter subunit IIA [Actinocrinis sp.]|jgi:PTS system N-acetylglucosamine-specific IIA component|uniref:PTS sugar transporter subunit IIA n=1 Tax=Actinocrinis sp. TaxID=1920516 RepID=UPI002DDDB313|nr:PTS glucose transporter subunit IIA [Actinocrinis sp.]HEV3169358.1 PTS glucose transporter subunit IIA [Actinocrinis sp.]
MDTTAATLVVCAPVPGMAIALGAVPDPVFAEAMVGPGAAVDPRREPQAAVSPIAGTLVKLKPHAFVVADGYGRGVLVHLGIDTVNLDGDGFELLAVEGQPVEPGTPVIRWDPVRVEAGGMSPVCPVIALDALADAVSEVALGPIEPCRPLFRWTGPSTAV